MKPELWVDFTNNQQLSDADIRDYVDNLNRQILDHHYRAVLMGPRLVGRIRAVDAAISTDEISFDSLFGEKPALPKLHF